MAVKFGLSPWERSRGLWCSRIVLRKVFEVKINKINGEWRKLHNAELHALYCSLKIIMNLNLRWLRWAGHVAYLEESRNVYRVLVRTRVIQKCKQNFCGKIWGKERMSRRCEDNIKMDFREMVVILETGRILLKKVLNGELM